MRSPVQKQPSEIQDISFFFGPFIILCTPAKLCFHSRHQLQWIERFRNIIIRSQRKPGDLIHVFRLRRQHDHRKCIFLPDLLEDLESVNIRKHNIQDRKIDLRTVNTVQCILAVVKFEYFVLVILEIKLYYISDFLFVIYY